MRFDGEFPYRVFASTHTITRADDSALPALESGKRINVALAAPYIDGVEISPDTPFSFWRTVPRLTGDVGFRPGIELRGGCIVPSVGGGICLLSNALFAMAAHLGWTILERHGHTMEAIPAAPDALDATVFWPHVDLRFAPRAGRVRLSVRVTGDDLIIEAWAAEPNAFDTQLSVAEDRIERTRRGPVRHRAIRRLVRDRRTGCTVESRLIALGRARILDTTEQRRNCYTCDETACHARPRDLPRGIT